MTFFDYSERVNPVFEFGICDNKKEKPAFVVYENKKDWNAVVESKNRGDFNFIAVDNKIPYYDERGTKRNAVMQWYGQQRQLFSLN